MNGLIDEWTDGFIEGWNNGQMDPWINKWMDQQTDVQIHGRMNQSMDRENSYKHR